MKRKLTIAAAAGLVLLAGGAGAAPTTVILNGEVTGGTQTLDLLSPTLTPLSFSLGGDTYSGVALWEALGGTLNGLSTASQIIPNTVTPGTSTNQPTLRSYLTVANAGGGGEIITAGEVNTFFGGGATPPPFATISPSTPYMVATKKNGVDIAPELIVTRDDSTARWLADLTTITVRSLNAPLPGPMPAPGAFLVSGLPTSLILDAALLASAAFTHVSQSVTFFSGANPSTRAYEGVTVWDILEAAGLGTPSTDALLHKALLATGTDGFQVVIALAELNPDTNSGDVGFISYSENGTTVVRLVMPGDFHGGRFVSGLRSLELIDLPEPPMVAILVLALAFMTMAARARRSRIS